MDRRNHNEADPVTSPESLTTSTESESFESWTLVTEGAKTRHPNKIALETEKRSDDEDSVILIEKGENSKKDNENVDDLSDGISIISDNESAGRISPHIFLEHSTTERNFPLIAEISSDVPYNPLTPPTTPRQVATRLEKKLDDIKNTGLEQPTSDQSYERPFFGLGVRGVFILCIVIAFAAFFGKLKYPEWEQLSLTSQLSPLIQRIEDLEMQNNLLRAEIDLLSKKVNYLNQIKDKSIHRGDRKSSYKQEVNQHGEKNPDPPKVWSGADDLNIEEPEEIVFKPSSFDYEEIEQQFQPPKHSEFHKEIPDVKISRVYHEQRQAREETKYERERKPKYENHQKYPSGDDKIYDNSRYKNNDNDKQFVNEDRRKDKSKEYHSKERLQTDEYDKSRKQQNRKDEKHENDWHERMMQQREDTRKNREKHNTDNWYIERANGRQEARTFDKGDEYRKDRQ